MNLLISHPSSALCSAAVDEINRLMRDSFEFWMEQFGESSGHCDREAIAGLLRRYEAAAEALSPELCDRARAGAAETRARLDALLQ